MIPTDHFLPFLVTALVVILIPGPNVLFVVGRALAHGRRTALLSAAGGSTGSYIQAVLVSLGLGTLVARSDAAFAVLKLIGAAYLVFLGVEAVRHRRDLSRRLESGALEEAAAGQRADTLRSMRQGLLVGLTNPKVTVFFGAILPQFVDRSSGRVPEQMVVLATVFCSIAVVCDCGWGLAAGSARDWFARSPRRMEMVGGAGGLAMMGLGVTIAVTGRKS